MSKRNYNTHIYLTIAIEKDSPTHRALVADALEIGTKQYPTVAAMRLKDYYAGLRGTPVPSPSPEPIKKEEQAVLKKDQATAEANADAALDEW